MRHVQETACREVDLRSCYLEGGSKPGLNRAFRSLRRQGQHINTCIYNNSKQQRQSNNEHTGRRTSTAHIHRVTTASTPSTLMGVNLTTANSMLQQRQHRQYDKQQVLSSVMCIDNSMFTLGRYPVRINKHGRQNKNKQKRVSENRIHVEA